MKKLLFLLLLPVTVKAQINVSVLGGVAGKSLVTSRYKTWSNKNFIEPYVSLQVSTQIKKYSFGIKGDIYKIKSKQEIKSLDSAMIGMKDVWLYSHAFNPGFNLSLFANKNWESSKSIIYAGLSMGYMLGSSRYYYKPELPTSIVKPDNTSSASAFTVGLQVGYKYKLTKNITILAELSPRYVSCIKAFGKESAKRNYNALVIPVAAGLSFSF